MRRIVSLSALFITFGFLSGCVSQPQTVKASLPLVNPAFALTGDSQKLSSHQNKAKAIPELSIQSGGNVVIEGNSYHVSEKYTSALGVPCHRLNRIGHSGAIETRPVCQYQNHWLLYPALVISNS